MAYILQSSRLTSKAPITDHLVRHHASARARPSSPAPLGLWIYWLRSNFFAFQPHRSAPGSRLPESRARSASQWVPCGYWHICAIGGERVFEGIGLRRIGRRRRTALQRVNASVGPCVPPRRSHFAVQQPAIGAFRNPMRRRNVRKWHVRDVTPAATRAAVIKGAADMPPRSPFMLRPRCRTLRALSCSDPE